jgi:hypothetical protein
MKISSVKIDSARVEQGVWVGNIPELDDAELLVRGWNNVAFRRLQQKLIRALPRSQRSGAQLDPKVQDQINARCMRETILFGWRRIEDDQCNEIPFDKELAGKWLEDPDMRTFYEGVMWASMNVAEEAAEEEEAIEKNLPPPSGTP